eukprot:gene2672-2077_t
MSGKKNVRPAFSAALRDEHRFGSADTVTDEVYAAEKRLMALADEAVPKALANFLRDLNFNFSAADAVRLSRSSMRTTGGRYYCAICRRDDAKEQASKLEAYKQIDVVENKKVLLEKLAARCGIS